MAVSAPDPPHRRRPAPQIYRVPPPVASRRFVLLAAIGPGAVAVAMGGMIALTEWARDPGAAWNDIHTAAIGLVALGVLATVFIGVAWGAINRRRARFVADHGLPAADELTRKLNDLPRPPAFLPRSDQIYQRRRSWISQSPTPRRVAGLCWSGRSLPRPSKMRFFPRRSSRPRGYCSMAMAG